MEKIGNDEVGIIKLTKYLNFFFLKKSVLSIFDTAGQEEFSGIRDQYLRTGDGFVLVFSLVEESSFNKVN